MILIEPETEALVRKLARDRGVTIEEVVKAAVERSAREAGVAVPATPENNREAILAGIEAIARRCASRPVLDPRLPDDIIGYDEFGVPK